MTRQASVRRPVHRPPRQRPAPVAFRGRRLGADSPPRLLAASVFRAEVLGFLRDRRALLSAVVLPVLLYPLVFFFNSWMERVSRETMAARKVTIALDLSETRPALAEELRRLLEDEPPLELVDFDARRLDDQVLAEQEGRPTTADSVLRVARELLAEGNDLLIADSTHSVLSQRDVFRVFYDGSVDLGNEAHRRARKALDVLGRREAAARRADVLGDQDPVEGLDATAVDVATSSQTGGAALGRFLPLIAMLVLVSGGAYGALSAFAGERENRTLETLLVQPVPAPAIAWGKFAAVTLLALAALLSNAGSLLGSVALGLGQLPGMAEADGGASVALEAGRLALGAFAFLPAAVALCALLCLTSVRARSFREGQHAIFPLTLVAALPAAAAGFADIELDLVTAWVPLLAPSLALRDAVMGRLELLPGAVAIVTGWGWAWVVASRLAGTLDAERILQGEDTERELALRGLQSRAALAWGFAAVFLIYFVGGWLQSRRLLAGLMLTLWGLAPILALLAARGAARRGGLGLGEVLSLRLPRLAHLGGALLLAPALAWLMRAWVPLQQRLLPMPSSQAAAAEPLQALTELSPWALFFVLAVTPGVCEELLFRGAIQGGLVRDLSARRVVLWQALLFGLAHASVYRFVPTALLGGVLAALVLRSRSLWTAIALHIAYDGLLVLSIDRRWLEDPRLAWLALPGLALLVLSGPRSGTRDGGRVPLPGR